MAPPARVGYNVSASPGVYTVRLHLANTFAGTSRAGTRVFNIFLDDMNTPVHRNVDIIALVGDKTGTRRSRSLGVRSPSDAHARAQPCSWMGWS
jgi:hypothetical protein